MSGVPYIRFFGDDWLSGTQDLSLEERGALVTIVALTSATGQPPALDYKRLARRFGCTPGKAKKVIAALEEQGKISIEGEVIHNARALSETEISQKKSEKQSENASARWSKKAEKANENNGGCDAMALPRECQPEPEPEPIEEDTNVSLSSGDDLGFLPVDEIAEAVTAFNVAAEASGWPKVKVLSKARRSALAARLRECGGLAGWRTALLKAQSSPHCCGQNNRGWVANFDFLTRQSSFAKLMEGNYDNRDHHHATAAGRQHPARAGGYGSGTVDAFAAVAAQLQREQAGG